MSTERYRVVFMGTPRFALPTLERLLAEHDVVGVYTQPDRPAGRGRRVRASPVKRLAEANDVPVVQPRSLRKEPDAVERLRALAPEVVVVAAYGLILPPDVLEIPEHGTLNVHASLLPRWRGAAPVTHAILAGDEETGATIMLVDEGLDTGPVLARRAVTIGPDETAGELTERLSTLGAALLAETLPRWMRGEITPQPQDEALATYAPRLERERGRLDWSADARELARQVRALHPWPGAFTTADGERLKLHRVAAAMRPADVPDDAAPGYVTAAADGTPLIVAGSGALRLERVQPAGKRQMDGADFLRGRSELTGTTLGGSDAERA